MPKKSKSDVLSAEDQRSLAVARNRRKAWVGFKKCFAWSAWLIGYNAMALFGFLMLLTLIPVIVILMTTQPWLGWLLFVGFIASSMTTIFYGLSGIMRQAQSIIDAASLNYRDDSNLKNYFASIFCIMSIFVLLAIPFIWGISILIITS